MKVVFLEDVAGTADAGEIKEVKNGFARNFLLPKRLAAPVTPDQLQRIRAIEKAAQEKRLKYSKEWSEVAKAMDGTQITIVMRVGPTGRLFGAVTGRHIAEELSKATGREVDHRQVLLGSSIHEPGDTQVDIRLYRDVHATVTVSVVPEGYTEEQAARAAAGETAEPPTAEDSEPSITGEAESEEEESE